MCLRPTLQHLSNCDLSHRRPIWPKASLVALHHLERGWLAV